MCILASLLLEAIGGAQAQPNHFRVIEGIPHLPVVDPAAITSPATGMLVYSTSDQMPMLYTGTGWESMCSSGLSGVMGTYFEVKDGYPFMPGMGSAPGGIIEPGSVFYSKAKTSMMVHNGNVWTKADVLKSGNTVVPSTGFSARETGVFKLPVLNSHPAPGGLSAGGMYINSFTKNILFYDGSVWRDIDCYATITTLPVFSISNTQASSGVDIASNGGSPIVTQGLCWGTMVNPTIALGDTTRNAITGSDIGTFPGIMKGLLGSTTYHVRAYAINAAGVVVYGNDLSFTTAAAAIPTLITLEGSQITPTTAVSGGDITNTGGANITFRGIIYSALGDPLLDPSSIKTDDGTGVGVFPSRMTDLQAGKKYYVRAWATNMIGTAYGNLVEINTNPPSGPILSTPNIYIKNITDVSAETQVTILSNGGSTVLERGVSWSTDRVNITYNPSTTVNATDVGTFDCFLKDLQPGTLYYVRAYAINAVDTSYSSETSFWTTSLPTVFTDGATNYDYASAKYSLSGIRGTSAIGNATITSTGASPLLNHGFVWSTTAGFQADTVLNNRITLSAGSTGIFNSTISALKPNTTYYIRAFAENDKGRAYGDEQSFTTAGPPVVSTTPASLITNTTAVSGGSISDDGRMPVTQKGICWNTTGNPTKSDTYVYSGNGSGAFSSQLSGLLGGKTYYIRAFAGNNVGITYGDELSFTTSNAVPATLSTTPVYNFKASLSTAMSGGNISNNGGAAIISRGVCWNSTGNPTINDSHAAATPGSGSFSAQLTSLVPNVTYYVRAYADNGLGMVYGNEVTFTTYTTPTLITTVASNISSTDADSGGDILADGGSPVTISGICWGTSPNPTIAANLGKTSGGPGIGAFIDKLKNLLGNTKYYIRAYATNDAGTAYGNEVNFTTLPPVVPSVQTNLPSNTTGTTATGNGAVINNGGAAVILRGVCWNTTGNPTLNDNRVDCGSGNGAFSGSMKGLSDNTVYYVRAFASNSVGTAYGQELSFQTGTLATVSTLSPVPGSISSTSATSGGDITNSGGSTVTKNGICWSTFKNPTINDFKLDHGSGTGSFTSILTGLLGNTKYYLRAFAINAAGVAYGNLDSLVTAAPVLPSVTTTAAGSIKAATAVSGGTISSNGGAIVGTRGIVWSVQPNFDPDTISNLNKTAMTGYSTGSFTSKLTGLQAGTTYYVRAYAVNSAGTAYGNVISFQTANVPTLITTAADPLLITKSTATAGGNISTDGGLPVTSRGVFWSTTADFVPDTLSADKTSDGSGIGSFTSQIKGLKGDTWYYIRAYAKNAAGFAFGNQLNFKTAPPTIAALTTTAASKINGTDAGSGGTITDEGGSAVTTRGVLWSIQSGFNPDTVSALHKVSMTGTGLGSFTSTLNGLKPGTTYYARAFAINGIGTAYGNEISFTTPDVPKLTTQPIASITGNSAQSGGNISSNGGKQISQYGVCWSTVPNPTTGLSTKEAKTGDPGSTFSSNLTGLAPVTTYYVRSFAINSEGTAYGNELSFTTPPVIPTLTTTMVTVTSDATALSGGTITDDGGAPVTARGVVWGTQPNPDISTASKTANGSGTGNFGSNLSGLTPRITYYARAYAINSAGIAYGNEITFSTFATTPLLTTDTLSKIDGMTATGGGNITSDGGSAVKERGVVWATTRNPTINLNTKVASGIGTGAFISQLSGLTPNTLYYVRAYAINDVGVSYGLEQSFVTAALPTLTATDAATSILTSTATSGGRVTDTGRMPILARGIVWSIYSSPTIALATKTVDTTSSSIGSFTAAMTGLSPNTTYYVRAYATNGVGTNYGSETIFKTKDLSIPALTTDAVTAIAGTTANSGGNITDDGGVAVTARGLCWSTSPNPTIALTTKVVLGTGMGTFSGAMAGLSPMTTYYVRAFATNSKGTAYGNEVSFTTTAIVPVLSAVTMSNIGMTSADASASITSNGGATVLDMGFIWNTTGTLPGPADSTMSKGALGTLINGTLKNLSPSTKYYVWAYATNNVGTGYSAVSNFTTPTLATLTTTKPSAVTSTTATGGGNISSDGGATVTQRGVCWSTVNPPTIADTKLAAATAGTGAFTVNITGLTKGTKYYVRAYATNSVGTSYGNLDSLTTLDLPTLTTTAASAVTGVSATSGGYISIDGGASVTARGVVWSTSRTPMPDISLTTKSSNGTGAGSFTSNLTGLALSTKYYFRAYATNSLGTAYGNLDSLKTPNMPPTLTALVISNLTNTSADGSATVTADGGDPVTDKGLVWNTTGNPTTADNKITSGVGLGSILGTLQNLSEGPTYYVRAYAINAAGTTYSNEQSFKICPTFSVQHTAGLNGAPLDKTVTYKSVSTSISGAARCWITQNLGADNQATSSADYTAAASGWYWQFNRPQGYNVNDNNARTPSTTWINTSVETTWEDKNDPCRLLLGGGWRLPTGTEWDNAYKSFNSQKIADAYTSVLKLHAGGHIDNGGVFRGRNATNPTAYYWSSTSTAAGKGTALTFTTATAASITTALDGAFANAARCLRDTLVQSSPSVGAVTLSNVTNTTADYASTVSLDGGLAVTERGLVWNTKGNPTLADNVKKDAAAGLGNFGGQLTGLTEGPTYYVRAYAINSKGTSYGPQESFKICPTFAVQHIAGLNGAPVSKTVTYKSVHTQISGASRCWIIQNLGADNQATSAADYTEAAAGWMWQFNRPQGYNVNGNNARTPSTTWITTSTETTWEDKNDPCRLLLGGGWRLPTATEWDNAYKSFNSQKIADAYTSVLKLHSGGRLDNGGLFNGRNATNPAAYYWSSTSTTAGTGTALTFTTSTASSMTTALNGNFGNSVRCLRDTLVQSSPSVGAVTVSNLTNSTADYATAVTLDGGAVITERGLVWNTTGNPTLADNVKKDAAAGLGNFSGQLTGLIEGPTYYVRAYAINSKGTSYGPQESFKICPTFTVQHIAGLNGAPVSKTVTYKSVHTQISGASRCWITKNLGADTEASGTGDYTAASAGWYWQFNRPQGYNVNDNNARTPTTAWIASSTEMTWEDKNDPCRLLLGGGWRLPTATELDNAYKSFNSTKIADAYASVLKLHYGGRIDNTASFNGRNATNPAAYYWSSTSTSVGTGMALTYVTATSTSFTALNGNYGNPVRCLRDTIQLSKPVVSAVTISNATSSTVDVAAVVNPDNGAPVTARGFVWNTKGLPTLADNVMTDAMAGVGVFNKTLSGLKDGPLYYVRAYATNSVGTAYGVVDSFRVCPTLTIQHIAGFNGAPVDKTVTYKSVYTKISGDLRCWLSQNLGASQEAASAGDTTAASAGWYFQFNKSKGYEYTSRRTPSGTWLNSISENSDWMLANDPCNLLLSGGWRLPSGTEWTNVDAAPQNWANSADAYNSVLKLHMAGDLSYNGGGLESRGAVGRYWSSTSGGLTVGSQLAFSTTSAVASINKAYALTLRCLRDSVVLSTPTVGTVSLSNITSTSVQASSLVNLDGGLPVTDRGIVWNTSGNPTLADHVLPLGSGLGSFSTSVTGLSEAPTYYMRAYATNGKGTSYGAEESFKICPSFTVQHVGGFNGAAVDKTITYHSVSTRVSGAVACWLTQNLGASQEATAAGDTTAASAGWYFQFNRNQAYQYTSKRTPSTTWVGAISESDDWVLGNDPCNLLLSTGWRLPTSSEWTNADAAPQNWVNSADAYNSVLKLHMAGDLIYSSGTLESRGSIGRYWSSTSGGLTVGSQLAFGGTSSVASINKAYALPVRCLRDTLALSRPTVSKVTISNVTMTSAQASALVNPDGGAPVTDRGLVWNTSGSPTLADHVLPAGSGTGSFSASLTGLSEQPTYFVRAYATNIKGTSYGAEESFKICPPSVTVLHQAESYGAPVNKKVTYGIVSTKLSGVDACWITRNLGADTTASTSADNSAAAAGWYYQFGLSKGYLPVSGSAAYPTWITSVTNGDWDIASDPCALQIGAGWRLPTKAEWTNANTQGGWTNASQANLSPLKLHMAGGILYSSGTYTWYLQGTGSRGDYWSSTSINGAGGTGTTGNSLQVTSSSSTLVTATKANGASIRCLRDQIQVTVPRVGNVSISKINTDESEGSATIVNNGGGTITGRGLVWNTTGNAPDINGAEKNNLLPGSASVVGGPFTVKLTGMTTSSIYYVWAYVTNSAGTTYSMLPARYCPPFTVQHIAGSVAPVSKTVTYRPVSTNISGVNRCWITQNLGAEIEANGPTDPTPEAVGWYWQFRQAQGYAYNGTSRTPSGTWPATASLAVWTIDADPCRLLLGGGWRIPTETEWTNADAAPQNWNNYTDAYNSVLKLHAAGRLSTAGVFELPDKGFFWNSTGTSTNGNWGAGAGTMEISGTTSLYSAGTTNHPRNGHSLRCIND